MGFFDFFKGKPVPKTPAADDLFSDPQTKQLMDMFVGSVVEERMHYAKTGERPETRLIPHIRIKLDIMIKAYESDLQDSIADVQKDPSMTASQKSAEVKRMQDEVAAMLYRLKRERSASMEALFERMKGARKDMRRFEEAVRSEQPHYNSFMKEFLT